MVRFNAHASSAYAFNFTFAFASLLAVILRFVARSQTKAKLALDDWLAVASLLSYYAWIVIMIWAAENGSGYAPKSLPPPVLIGYLKVAYAATILSTLPITLAKLSVLCLFHRLFGVNRAFHKAVVVVGILCIMWFVAIAVAAALRCIPVQKAWNPSISGHCGELHYFVVGAEVPNSLLDFVIVGLPLKLIMKLHLHWQHKVGLAVIFILGGFVGVIGIIRIALVYNPHGVSLSLLGHWVSVQLGVAIICSCLPTYRPLLSHLSFQLAGIKQWYSSLHSRLAKTTTSPSSKSNPSELDIGGVSGSDHVKSVRYNHYLNMEDQNDTMLLNTAVGGGSHDHHQGNMNTDFPKNGINVRKDVVVCNDMAV